jgi:hypothetical protein
MGRVWAGAGALVLALTTVGAVAGPQPDQGPDVALVQLGRDIYQDGRLPDGRPLKALRPEGFVLEGEHAACVTCHRESGMGSVEGSLEKTVLVPPLGAGLLFLPARFHGTFLNSAHHWVPNAAWARSLTRGAYDQTSLARSLREGLDPEGRPIGPPMPRYALDDQSVAALAAYLARLSAEPAPGTEGGELHLATVITPDAPPGHAESVMGVLEAWSRTSRASGRDWRLHRWALSGPAEGWPDQLDALYRERPVFALLSGVGGAQWGPVQVFCEANRIPCILPVLEAAPEAAPGFYSVYFSPGVGLEARLLAAHLAKGSGPQDPSTRVVQVVADASGRRAAEELASALGSGVESAMMHRYRPTAPGAGLDSLDQGTTLVLWLRPAALSQLVEAMPQPPEAGAIYLSSLLAWPGSVALPPAWKGRVTYVSLFDAPGLQQDIARLRLGRWLDQQGIEPGTDLRIQADAYAACYLFARALGEIGAQEQRRPRVPLSREQVLEVLETQVSKYADGTELVDPDGHVAYYGRMSLGPRQRMAVRGGALLRYGSEDSERLILASERIVP